MRRLLSCFIVVFLGTTETQSFAETVSADYETNFEEKTLGIATGMLRSNFKVFVDFITTIILYFENSLHRFISFSIQFLQAPILVVEKVCSTIYYKNNFLKNALS